MDECLKLRIYNNTLNNKSDLTIGMKLYEEILKFYYDDQWIQTPNFLSYGFRGSHHMEIFYMEKFKSIERHFKRHQKYGNKVSECGRCNLL